MCALPISFCYLEVFMCYDSARSVIGAYGLRRGQPQTYGIGLKELWQMPAGHAHHLPGLVEHTVGWPSVRTPVLLLLLAVLPIAQTIANHYSYFILMVTF